MHIHVSYQGQISFFYSLLMHPILVQWEVMRDSWHQHLKNSNKLLVQIRISGTQGVEAVPAVVTT